MVEFRLGDRLREAAHDRADGSSDALAGGRRYGADARQSLPCLAIPPRPSRDYDPDGLLWTYAEVAGRVTRLIERYAAAGYGHGHRVSLVLENRPEFMLHFLALNALGCWVVPLNPEFRQDDLTYVLGHSEVDLIVSLPPAHDRDDRRRAGARPAHSRRRLHGVRRHARARDPSGAEHAAGAGLREAC